MPLAPAPIDDDSPAAKLRAFIERLAKLLDPDYPSIVVEPPQPIPDGMAGRLKPDFVSEDDAGWVIEI